MSHYTDERDKEHGFVYEIDKCIEYKFREDELITEFSAYIDKTYEWPLWSRWTSVAEVIVDRGHGMGFFAGNIDKYNGVIVRKVNPLMTGEKI